MYGKRVPEAGQSTASACALVLAGGQAMQREGSRWSFAAMAARGRWRVMEGVGAAVQQSRGWSWAGGVCVDGNGEMKESCIPGWCARAVNLVRQGGSRKCGMGVVRSRARTSSRKPDRGFGRR